MLACIALVAAHALTAPFSLPQEGISVSEVCFRGNRMADLEGMFKRLKYRVVSTKTVDGGFDAITELARIQAKPGVGKFAYVYLGWTRLYDPEMVLMQEEGVLANLSKSMHTTIVSWVSDVRAKTYGFGFYEGGTLKRKMLAIDGHVSSSWGKKIPSEESINWTRAKEPQMMSLLKRLGVPYAGPPEVRFRVYELEEGSGG